MLEEDETVTQRVRGLPESFFAKPEAKAGRGRRGKTRRGGRGKERGRVRKETRMWRMKVLRYLCRDGRRKRDEGEGGKGGREEEDGEEEGGEESDGDESVKEEDEEGGGEKASTRKKNDGVKPKGGGGKRGVTAYGLFASIRRSELKKENPLLTSTAITKLLHEEFKALPRDARADLSREATSGPSRSASSPSSSSSDEEQPLIADDEPRRNPPERKARLPRLQKGLWCLGRVMGMMRAWRNDRGGGLEVGSFVEEEGVGGDDGQSVVMNSNPVKDEPNSSSPPPSPELLSAPLKTTDAPDAWFTFSTHPLLEAFVKTMGMDEMKKEGDATLAKKGKALGIVMPWDDDWGSCWECVGGGCWGFFVVACGDGDEKCGEITPWVVGGE
ncbi:hypothetical protein BC829DRAFT_451203 [Chytridium lagenaria]|nr:hypothetical protein BC829DRAFT_451203 [Chytridium lagenaria]